MAIARPHLYIVLAGALTLACSPRGGAPELPQTPAPGPWAAFATHATAGGEHCSVSRPVDLGAALSIRGGPGDVRIAAGRHGALVAWMQPHPTKPIGRLVAVRALDRQGNPIGVVQTMQPPVAAVLEDVVADDDGFYVLVQAPDQPRANHAIAVRPDGSAVGTFVEIADTGGLAPVSHGPARGPSAAVVVGPPIGGRESVWVTLTRTADGSVDVRTRPLPRWRGIVGADDARTWVGGEGRHALLLAWGDAPLELVADGDILRAGADLPGEPAIGLDARWRGEDVDLVWGAPGQAGPQIRRAILRASGKLEVDPPGLAAFEEAVALAWSPSPPFVAARTTFAGRPLTGPAIDVAAADPALADGLPGAAWAWSGEAFVLGYPALAAGGATTRTLRVTCPRG